MLLKPLARLIHLLLHPGQTPQMCHTLPLLPAAVFCPWLCFSIVVFVFKQYQSFGAMPVNLPQPPTSQWTLVHAGPSQRRLQAAWTSSFHFLHVHLGFMGCSESHFSGISETNGMVLIKHLSQHEHSLTVLIN